MKQKETIEMIGNKANFRLQWNILAEIDVWTASWIYFKDSIQKESIFHELWISKSDDGAAEGSATTEDEFLRWNNCWNSETHLIFWNWKTLNRQVQLVN